MTEVNQPKFKYALGDLLITPVARFWWCITVCFRATLKSDPIFVHKDDMQVEILC